MEEIPREREIPRARKGCSSEREGGDGRERRVVAVEEERERDSFSHHVDEVPRPLLPPLPPSSMQEEGKTEMFNKRIPIFFSFGPGPNQNRDRQRPILMDRRSRSGWPNLDRSLWNPSYSNRED